MMNVPFSSQLSTDTNFALLSFVQQAANTTTHNFVPVSSNTTNDKLSQLPSCVRALLTTALAMSCIHTQVQDCQVMRVWG